jgi:hypothetical protein
MGAAHAPHRRQADQPAHRRRRRVGRAHGGPGRQSVGLEADPHNFLLMHAMGPNVAGVIGSAVAAGVMITLVAGC